MRGSSQLAIGYGLISTLQVPVIVSEFLWENHGTLKEQNLCSTSIRNHEYRSLGAGCFRSTADPHQRVQRDKHHNHPSNVGAMWGFL